MKPLFAIAAASGLALTAAPAFADDHGTKANSPEVVETNARGQATKVLIDGKVYDVCMKDDQDGCINPRAAGLKWGNRPLSYWPGKPASEIEGPLPAEKPDS
ncbi:MAG: hypothetical protein JJ901_11740 [Erythrobacter sp.]|uniref:hypothetical protein n=1 Tax=Erythrobacter sp. TaxID=1042 RepID=UPI001B1CEE8A|nr:hypothetical protein [Erythrobacter sp.]MBO6768956.1 hypothetical protein [Erythrobacter sp.]